MRKVALTLAMMLASGSAMASSIDHIRGDRTSNNSVVFISCVSCPPPVKASAETAAHALQPGTQNVAIREVNGRKETVRTEALLGGAPVTYVSTNPVWLPQGDAAAALAAQGAPVPVDAATTTSAVDKAVEQGSSDISLLQNVADAPLRSAQ